jgi:restriction system protein
MPKRRQEKARAAELISAIPWWVWLAFGFATWLVARYLMGLVPASKVTPAQAVQLGLLKGIGTFLFIVGPPACLILAAISGVKRILAGKASVPVERLEPHLDKVTEAEQVLPRWGRNSSDSDLYEVWKDVAELEKPALDTTSWNIGLLKALEWKRLEQLSAVYFRTKGYRVEEAAPGPDGGVDLRLYLGAATTPAALVQCKAWQSWKVGVAEVRAHYGVMASEGVNEGIVVTTSHFTKEAVEWVRGKSLNLIDGDDLLKRLANLPPEDQAHILRLITSGDFTTPTCPSCGIKMVRRSAQATGDAFWGCTRFPKCRTTIRIGKSQATH